MRWLPIGALPTPVAMPLADSTAELLISALLTTDIDQRSQQLAAALAVDPPLAVWALCRANALGNHGLRALGPLADWLAKLPASGYFAAQDQDSSSAAPEIADAAIWADRAVTAISEATLAAQWARHAQLDEDQAYLFGLAHRAHDWLAAQLDGDAQSAAAMLPGWLAAVRPAADSSVGASPAIPAECVAVACRELVNGETSTHAQLPFEFDWASHSAIIANARTNCLRSSGGGARLHALLDALTRLEALQSHFESTLEAAKLDSLKELAYGASHEINNPLANISARAQTLLADERDPERRRKLATINTQALRAHEMIADMMLFARPPKPKLEGIDMATLVARLVAELSPAAAGQGTQLVFQTPAGPIPVRADKTQLAVAVRALCSNALEALVHGGRIDVSLERSSTAEAPENFCEARETVQLTVADNGPGIAPSAKRYLFDPFYCGREAGRGLGLGLSKCWRIVTMHGGRIEVQSQLGEGARFTICLPIDPAR